MDYLNFFIGLFVFGSLGTAIGIGMYLAWKDQGKKE
jgi:hypothetical protein